MRLADNSGSFSSFDVNLSEFMLFNVTVYLYMVRSRPSSKLIVDIETHLALLLIRINFGIVVQTKSNVKQHSNRLKLLYYLISLSMGTFSCALCSLLTVSQKFLCEEKTDYIFQLIIIIIIINSIAVATEAAYAAIRRWRVLWWDGGCINKTSNIK